MNDADKRTVASMITNALYPVKERAAIVFESMQAEIDSLKAEVESLKAKKTRRPATVDDPQFAAFWASCPRKIGKGKARTQYVKALKQLEVEGRPEPAAILLGAMQAHAKAMHGKESDYIPHPATWLAGSRWDDDLSTDSGKLVVAGVVEDRAARRKFFSAGRANGISETEIERKWNARRAAN